MSIDYFGAQKIKEHEEQQDQAISAGGSGGDFVPVVNVSQFVMGPDEQTPIPVVDDMKTDGMYSVMLDLSALGMAIKFTYWLLVTTTEEGTQQVLTAANLGFTFARSYVDGNWTSWVNGTPELQAGLFREAAKNLGTNWKTSGTQVLKNIDGSLTWVDE